LRDFVSVFFLSCPSCLAKCKQRLSNIFVAKSYQKPKMKNGMNEIKEDVNLIRINISSIQSKRKNVAK